MAARLQTAGRMMLGAISAAGAGYVALAALAWLRYAKPDTPRADSIDPWLDAFMPVYDIAERHHIKVSAPAATTFAAACGIDLQGTSLARLIFRAREVVLGAHAEPRQPRGIVDETRALGWGVLKEVPGREIVMGAVTRPWEADVVFRPLPPEAFAAFDEPGFVKIVWTLRADPLNANESIFRTETRARATDQTARARFRRYWALVSPGIILIRWALLRPLKLEAERKARRSRREEVSR